MLQPFLRVLLAAVVLGGGGQSVSLRGGRVSFVLPPDLRAMTPAQITQKYPAGPNTPQHVYANAPANVSIAVTFSPARVAPGDLEKLKTVLERSISQRPGTRWIKREMTTLNGRRFIHLEMTTQALDTSVYNDMYFTSLDGKMLGFNFNATTAMRSKMQAALRQSRDSIRVSGE